MKINLKTANKVTQIHAEAGALSSLGSIAAELVKGHRAAIVSDSNVAPLYLERAKEVLTAAGFSVGGIVVPAGEVSKQPEKLLELWAEFNKLGITRKDVIVALGGGVVGDLSGFAAATYLRGCPIIQVPTSLLAMVDSSIGGKTGIDLPFGKNLAGAFHQPVAVVTDSNMLQTLPQNRYTEGMAEVIKYGCISDAELFRGLECGSVSAEEFVARSISIKAGVVERDEFDLGERMLLNFGHTVGHAIEKNMGFGGISHGEAVAIGMVIAAKLGVRLGVTPQNVPERIISVLERYGLPTSTTYSATELDAAISSDKKNLANKLHFVLLENIGKGVLYPIEPAALIDELKAILI
jgi:3-dehydroquinate synthase